VVGKIVYLRTTYHFEPAQISMYLNRYHDLEVSTSATMEHLLDEDVAWSGWMDRHSVLTSRNELVEAIAALEPLAERYGKKFIVGPI
jgi:hypothetical protein